MPISNELKEFAQRLLTAAEPTFWGYLGCKLLEMDGQRVIISLDIQDHHLNVMEILHGGVHAALLDNAMGLAAMAARPEADVVTTNLNVHFTAPIRKGTVLVRSEVLHASAKMLTAQGTIHDADGAFCSLATGTFRMLKRK